MVFGRRESCGRLGHSLRVRVFYHDKCFDGASSAALFSRFYRERIRGDADFTFTGLVHRAGALFDEKQFDGEENAIVDFKYSPSPRITWWFDHHLSAFLTPQDHAQYLRGLEDVLPRGPSCARSADPILAGESHVVECHLVLRVRRDGELLAQAIRALSITSMASSANRQTISFQISASR